MAVQADEQLPSILIFREISARRRGLIVALTSECREFYKRCKKDDENLCLYGLPNEAWDVTAPDMKIPPRFPEPLIGINLFRNRMEKRDFFHKVAIFSDAWLVALASYYFSAFSLPKKTRGTVMKMLAELPSVAEEVIDWHKNINDPPVLPPQIKFKAKRKAPETTQASPNSSEANPNCLTSRAMRPPKPEKYLTHKANGMRATEEDDPRNTCSVCTKKYQEDENWIECYGCMCWYHMDCVGVPLEIARKIKFKCPFCKAKQETGRS